MTNFRACVAEFLGTFYLCFAGIAALIANTPAVGADFGVVGVALAHGLALSIAVMCFGGISGAHLNPAVTIGFLSVKRIKYRLAFAYIMSQLAGATTAAGVCRVIFTREAVLQANLGLPLPAAWATPVMVVTAEAIMTFLLMTAIFGTAVDERGRGVKIGGFGIGLVVTFNVLAGGAITGASMNPARSFGPALEMNYFFWHWAYWVAPITGAVLAAQLYDKVLLPVDPHIEAKG
jgi:MIP family channel proteins